MDRMEEETANAHLLSMYTDSTDYTDSDTDSNSDSDSDSDSDLDTISEDTDSQDTDSNKYVSRLQALRITKMMKSGWNQNLRKVTDALHTAIPNHPPSKYYDTTASESFKNLSKLGTSCWKMMKTKWYKAADVVCTATLPNHPPNKYYANYSLDSSPIPNTTTTTNTTWTNSSSNTSSFSALKWPSYNVLLFEDDPFAKPSPSILKSNLNNKILGDGDVWVEKICQNKKTGKIRSYFYSSKTGKRVRDEPPTGASKVIYL